MKNNSCNFETLGLFPIPLIKIKFEDHYKYNFPEIGKNDHKPEGWELSLNTSFPIINDNDPIVSSSVRDSLKIDLKDSIMKVFEELMISRDIDFADFWYNIYHEQQGQEPHRHLPLVGGVVPFWSGIYYNKNASPTQFFRPDKLYLTQIFEGYQETGLSSCLVKADTPFVEDGDILLFPPYLEHSVQSEPRHKDNMRMTFSFNINLN